MSSDSAYVYDALNRLTSEIRTGTSGGTYNYTKTYAFDSVGQQNEDDEHCARRGDEDYDLWL